MVSFEKRISQVPQEIQQAWSMGFVFMYNGKNFQHFPARQWTDEQIKNYFFEHFDAQSRIISHPELQLKELQLNDHPELLVIIPY
ncbi:hypothetical protein ACQKTA_03885 [Enterococcus sp. 22-H-5-01]|uniref:hypothetical protein n=1 Tax=Enterococcus sp. 22-H-5-01 TaxID=3418555 RepID=UPI003D021639